jgi:hypothetical protein
MNWRRIFAISALAFITAATALFFRGYTRGKTTAERFDLSPADLITLETRASQQRDGDAALRVALYFKATKHDFVSGNVWLHKAIELGNEDAKGYLNENTGNDTRSPVVK